MRAPRRILRATPPAAGPHSRGVGCWLCCAGWAGLLGWAGLAMLARMSWAGWAGQVRLAGLAVILSPFCLVVVLVLVFVNLFMLFLTLCSSFGSLWATILDHFGTFGGPFGVPGSSLGSFVHTFWAALSPKVQNVCKMWFPNPKGVILGDQFWHLFCIFFKKNECVESVGSQVVFSALFCCSRDRLTLHPLQPAQSNHSFSCSVSP